MRRVYLFPYACTADDMILTALQTVVIRDLLKTVTEKKVIDK
jgi:hypothetical protein